ncbi:hypothetical protein [Roseovarius sp. 2305UL8-3]|uniref:CIS tube protein n=1 Tax=Roseovarius conchicola TaxID=3121636 RepID=UPI0035294FB9
MVDLEIMAFSDAEQVSQIGITVVRVTAEALYQTKPEINETQVFQPASPATLVVEIILDATGVEEGKGISSVPEAIENFKKLTYDYNGSLHSPNFLKLRWDGNELRCRLAGLNLDYLLFDPSGAPLRCRLNATFIEHQATGTRDWRSGKKSADMTREVATAPPKSPRPEAEG